MFSVSELFNHSTVKYSPLLIIKLKGMIEIKQFIQIYTYKTLSRRILLNSKRTKKILKFSFEKVYDIFLNIL